MVIVTRFGLSSPQISGREMFEFNPDLVQGDDQEAAGDELYTQSEGEEEGEEGEGEGERGEEGRDITDTAGYSDEVLAPAPLPQSSMAGSNHQSVAAAGTCMCMRTVSLINRCILYSL